MNSNKQNRILEEIVAAIEIPESAYKLAEKRYKDLGDWFSGPNARSSSFKPHIHPQGSFRLGTVIRPLDEYAAYDLDLSCKLEAGVSRLTYTQEQLKKLVGDDVENYRDARGIKEKVEEKRRCWRLEYADTLSFHMDIVPCIPEDEARREVIRKAMLNEGAAHVLAQDVANLAASITDNEHPTYRILNPNWNVSNPEGYALWFIARMEQARELTEARLKMAKKAMIDAVPTYQWKTPLQKCIQVLKRHRDVMFRDNPEGRPISIIITTLSARAYQGEVEIGDAMNRILTNMEELINRDTPRVPNPVNSEEDFADKWDTPDGRAKRLEYNFRLWLQQVRADFERIMVEGNADVLLERAIKRFAARLNVDEIHKVLGSSTGTATLSSPTAHRINAPAKPWRL